ncbi:hypothetical protein [Neptunomonas concharum]|uniref:hypothetical protein n=1 Tax=Neptunomonas concharum TaxID=1031538 RepID=UPI003B82CC61
MLGISWQISSSPSSDSIFTPFSVHRLNALKGVADAISIVCSLGMFIIAFAGSSVGLALADR